MFNGLILKSVFCTIINLVQTKISLKFEKSW